MPFDSKAIIEKLKQKKEEELRAEQARIEAERLQREKEERERKEAAEKARLEKERAEQARLEAERLQREKKERERKEAEEKARLEKERAEQARLEAERLQREKEKREKEEAEKARLEKLHNDVLNAPSNFWLSQLLEAENYKSDPKIEFYIAKKYRDMGNNTKAFLWAKKAAEQGFTDAQYLLGKMYENGEGTDKNINEAISWYSTAGRNKNAAACYALGELYLKTEESKAFYWYSLAVKQNSDEKIAYDAKYRLSYCYQCGYGVQRNVPMAARLYLEAENSPYKYYSTSQFDSQIMNELLVADKSLYYEIKKKIKEEKRRKNEPRRKARNKRLRIIFLILIVGFSVNGIRKCMTSPEYKEKTAASKMLKQKKSAEKAALKQQKAEKKAALKQQKADEKAALKQKKIDEKEAAKQEELAKKERARAEKEEEKRLKNLKPGKWGEAGVIFYDKGEYSDGWRFLEFSPEILVNQHFSDSNIKVAGLSSSVGRGDENTRLLIENLGWESAAGSAANYDGGGKTDWYLGNTNEMGLLYENIVNKGGMRRKIKKLRKQGKIQQLYSGFGDYMRDIAICYLTSNQSDAENCMTYCFVGGSWLSKAAFDGGQVMIVGNLWNSFEHDYYNIYKNCVRPIRKF